VNDSQIRRTVATSPARLGACSVDLVNPARSADTDRLAVRGDERRALGQPTAEAATYSSDLGSLAHSGPTAAETALRQLQNSAGNAAVARAVGQLQRAGKRRTGTEHGKGARPSTRHDHEVGQSRKQAQESAADERNRAAEASGDEHEQQSVLAEILSRLRNLPDKVRAAIRNRGDHGLEILREELAQRRSFDIDAELASVGLTPDDLKAFLRSHGAVDD
jgi:hypothetical protein